MDLLLLVFFLCLFLFISLLATLYLLYILLQKSISFTTTDHVVTPETKEEVIDTYTPDYADKTIALENFIPKKGVKVKFQEEDIEDQITPSE